MQAKSAQKTERTILKISFFTGLAFAVAELLAAIWSGSSSMLMDAAYDTTELIVIALAIFLTPLFYKPVTEKLPFGYSQVESVFIVIKNLMMLSVTVGLLSDTIKIMVNGGNAINSTFVATFQLVLGCISVVVLIVVKKLNRQISSPLITTEVYSWKIDTFYSFGMAGAFFLAPLLKDSALVSILPYFDQIVAIIIVVCMMPQAVKMLIGSLKNMFLFSPDSGTVNTVKTVAAAALQPFGYSLISCDIYKTGRMLWAELYVATGQDSLLVAEFENASTQVQTQLAQVLEDCQSSLILQNAPSEEAPNS